tara:strand:- start:137297 stop:138400 length:1104 start_codon:yes stop_codon:yes gene_type:complete
MKQIFFFFCVVITIPFYAQEKDKKHVFWEVDYFYGTILEHNPDIGHLITHHPEGFIVQQNFKTFGLQDWERRYNYPDWGFAFSYQDLKNPSLGEMFSLYSHLSFYFLNRNFKVSVMQGVAYATNPYDQDENYRNNAFGSRFVSATAVKTVFTKENIWQGIGFQAGISLIHYSNGNFRAPNTSTNTFAFNVGLNYQMKSEELPNYIPQGEKEKYSEPLAFNLVFRSGVNESDVIGMGQYPFYIVSAFADKKINRKSTFQAGVDVFFSMFLKELIYYRSVASPELDISGDEDFKRVGLFVGHEFRFNKNAIVTHLGYYIYYPFDFEGRVYNRLGLKRYFGESEKIFGTVSVKAHTAKAEAIEFGIGIRL